MSSKYATKLPAQHHTSKISRLSNSIYFFIETVILLQDESIPGYRLIFHQDGAIIADIPYSTVRGAKIAFAKYCETKAYTEQVKADWTQPYFPEKKWLNQILSSPRKIEIEGKKPTGVLGEHSMTQTTSPDLDKINQSHAQFQYMRGNKESSEVHAETKIAVLINKHHYKLNDAIIIQNPGDVKKPYWLLIIHTDNQKEKKSYKTLRGVKIAFSRCFQSNANTSTIPEWTHFYPPETEWLKEKMAQTNELDLGV